jgi:hypothetical protein
MLSARSKDAAVVGGDWELCSGPGFPSAVTSDPGCSEHPGLGCPAVVLQAGAGASAGRVLVASRSDAVAADPAEVTWSDTGGGPVVDCANNPPWRLSQALDSYGDPAGVHGSIAGIRLPGYPVPAPPDVRLGYHSDVSIAADPNHPGEVWVLQNGLDPADPQNLDLFLSWTDTAGDTSQNDPGPKFQSLQSGHLYSTHSRTYRIPDSALAQPGELGGLGSIVILHQFMGKVAIDNQGGINLLFLCARETTYRPEQRYTPVSVRYARWPSRQALEAGQPGLKWSSDDFQAWQTTDGNDYIGLTFSGCAGYGIYSDDLDGSWRIKVVKIILPCLADVTADGVINSADASVFGSAYIAQQPLADVNRDSAINAQDVTDFVTAFTCGSCAVPQP